MTFIRITKIFSFEMAHLLQNHHGLCRNIHGHSYSLHVCVGGQPVSNAGSPDDGMVYDFADLKHLIQVRVINQFDHCLAINENLEGVISENLKALNLKIVCLPTEPTSEYLISYFAEIVSSHLPTHLKLLQLRLYETNSSYVDWLAGENASVQV